MERLGTLAYPVTIGIVDDRGDVHRAVLSNGDESVEAVLPAPLSRIVIDPDGVIPMFSSGNAEIRQMVVAALRGAGIPDTLLDDSRGEENINN